MAGVRLRRRAQRGLETVRHRRRDGACGRLGGLLASMPQARARIAGYADPRGSDAYNDELSLRRAQAVAAVLMSAGVPGERILIEAHGKTESTSAAGDLDAYALERRVTVRVELQGSGRVARRD